jgi:hypothetical protein
MSVIGVVRGGAVGTEARVALCIQGQGCIVETRARAGRASVQACRAERWNRRWHRLVRGDNVWLADTCGWLRSLASEPSGQLR